MKLALIIHSTISETVWNAFRFGVFSLKQGDAVQVFLLGPGVEAESLDTDAFKVTEQMKAFVTAGGKILACGTCLKIRDAEGSEMCPISTMQDMHALVASSDRVLTF